GEKRSLPLRVSGIQDDGSRLRRADEVGVQLILRPWTAVGVVVARGERRPLQPPRITVHAGRGKVAVDDVEFTETKNRIVVSDRAGCRKGDSQGIPVASGGGERQKGVGYHRLIVTCQFIVV
ncbi:MAG: hypothetical protein ACK56I_31255, partial [bacterium]